MSAFHQELSNKHRRVCSEGMPNRLPCGLRLTSAAALLLEPRGSNSVEVMDVGLLLFPVCYAGSGLCDKLIIPSQEIYRVRLCALYRVCMFALYRVCLCALYRVCLCALYRVCIMRYTGCAVCVTLCVCVCVRYTGCVCV